MLPAEPGSTPPPPCSARSNGLDEPARFPSSALRASPRMHEPRQQAVMVHAHRARNRYRYCRRVLPDPQSHEARHQRCHASCSARFARAKVAGNSTRFFPALQRPPRCHGGCAEDPLARQPPRPPNGMPPAANAPAGRSSTRRAVPTHAVSPALVLPPWNPPLRGAPFQKRNPPGGRTHPGGHSTALFRLCVAALHRERIQHLPQTADAGHVHGLGGRHHSAAPPIPPTPQGSRAHRPFYELSPECPASCFGGQGRAGTGSLHFTRSRPLHGVRFADLML